MHLLITISSELNDLQPLRQFMCKREISVFRSAALTIYMDNGVKTLSGRFRENSSRRRSNPSCCRCVDSFLLSPSPPRCGSYVHDVFFSLSSPSPPPPCTAPANNQQLKVFRQEWHACRRAGGCHGPAFPALHTMKTKAFCGRGEVPILRQWWCVSVQPELDFSPGFSVM